MQLFLLNLGSFSLLELKKPHFLARTHIEYFHFSIFVTLGVYLIKKIWVTYPGIFFSIWVLVGFTVHDKAKSQIVPMPMNAISWQ